MNYLIGHLAVDVQRIVDQHAGPAERVRAIEPFLARWMAHPDRAGQAGGEGGAGPFLARWMAGPDLTDEQRSPCEGRACGHLLHTAADGSFFIISVVLPPGASSGAP